jgi:ketol-acid reductoisomerase
MKLYYDNDADLSVLEGKKIAVIGYGSQGTAQALMLHDSGIDVVVGVREGGQSWKNADADGLNVMPIAQAAKEADIIHILLPDEVQGKVYENEIKEHVVAGKTLCFSHGFSIVYNQIQAPEGVDVIMVAPKSPGSEERKAYLAGGGVPALIAVKENDSGGAFDTALAMAKAMHFTKAGVLECTFEQEVFEDLFGEQAILCGGVTELIKKGFEVLIEAGYPPEMAYFECLHELKLIVDLIQKKGISGMYSEVSNTAEYGGQSRGEKIIDERVKEKMKELLKEVEDGSFAKEWISEFDGGMEKLKELIEKTTNHPIEITGKKIRNLFNFK